ncbi:hypothetical protein CR513_32233, partial [Mucuna pruriens]
MGCIAWPCQDGVGLASVTSTRLGPFLMGRGPWLDLEARVTGRIKYRKWVQNPWGREERWGRVKAKCRIHNYHEYKNHTRRRGMGRCEPSLFAKAQALAQNSHMLPGRVHLTLTAGVFSVLRLGHRLDCSASQPSKLCALALQEDGKSYRRQSSRATSLTVFGGDEVMGVSKNGRPVEATPRCLWQKLRCCHIIADVSKPWCGCFDVQKLLVWELVSDGHWFAFSFDHAQVLSYRILSALLVSNLYIEFLKEKHPPDQSWFGIRLLQKAITCIGWPTPTLWPRIAPNAELDASHIISNGRSQFGACKIGADVSRLDSGRASLDDGARCYHWRFSRLRKCRLGTKKPKVARGDQLDYQHTLMDLILSVLASRGEPSPSTMAIAVEDGITESRPCSQSDSVAFVALSRDRMENNDRILKELAIPDVVYQPWCIQYSQLEPTQTYELKSGLIDLLPKFHGLAGEDPHKHLKEFHVVCSTIRPQGIPKDYIKMKAFPFSLDGAVKDWLYLQPALFNTWGDMKCIFLESSFRHPELRPSGKKYVGAGSIQERLYTNIGRDLASSMPPVHTIRSVNNY